MAKERIEFEIDSEIAEKFDEICDENYVAFLTAIDLFIESVIKNRKSPFEIPEEIPNEETLQVMRDSANGIGLSEPIAIDEYLENSRKLQEEFEKSRR